MKYEKKLESVFLKFYKVDFKPVRNIKLIIHQEDITNDDAIS
jgi:hypothetical protein